RLRALRAQPAHLTGGRRDLPAGGAGAGVTRYFPSRRSRSRPASSLEYLTLPLRVHLLFKPRQHGDAAAIVERKHLHQQDGADLIRRVNPEERVVDPRPTVRAGTPAGGARPRRDLESEAPSVRPGAERKRIRKG